MGDKTYTDDGRVVGEDLAEKAAEAAPQAANPPASQPESPEERQKYLDQYVGRFSAEADLKDIDSRLERLAAVDFTRMAEALDRTNLPVKSMDEIKYLRLAAQKKLEQCEEEFLQKYNLVALAESLDQRLLQVYQLLDANRKYFKEDTLYPISLPEKTKRRYCSNSYFSDLFFGYYYGNVICLEFNDSSTSLAYSQNVLLSRRKKSFFSRAETFNIKFCAGHVHPRGLSGFAVGGTEAFLQQLTNYLRNPLQQEEWRSEGGYHRYVFPNEHTVYFLKMLLKREGCYQGVQELIAKEQGKEAKSKVDLQALFTELKEDGSK